MTNTTTSEYLQRQLIDMVELVKHSGTNSVEFVQAQAPDVVHQVLVWGMAESIVWIALTFVVLAVCFFLTKKCVKNNWECSPFVYVFVGGFGGGCSLIVMICNVMSLVKIIVAPKLYLLHYVAQLFK